MDLDTKPSRVTTSVPGPVSTSASSTLPLASVVPDLLAPATVATAAAPGIGPPLLSLTVTSSEPVGGSTVMERVARPVPPWLSVTVSEMV